MLEARAGKSRTVSSIGEPSAMVIARSHLAISAIGFSLIFGIVASPLATGVVSGAPNIAIALALAAALVVLCAIDATTLRLPNVLTVSLVIAGIALAPLELMAWRALSAAIAGAFLLAFALIYRHLRQHDGLGLGDVKLFAGAGAWVGMEGLTSVLLIACASALLTVLFRTLLIRSVDRMTKLAFGPFIALGIWTVWLYGPIDRLAS